MKNLIRFSIIVIFIFIIWEVNKDTNKYIEYERYLTSIYNKIPHYTDVELNNIPKPEHPHLAGFQNRFMTIDPNLKRVPSERLHKAFKDIISRPQQHRNIIWNNTPSMMGGRTRTIMFDPNDDTHKKVWAAGVSGGLWYNNDVTNPSDPWHSIDDFWDNLSVSKICHDPNEPMIFYVGTGEANTAIITYRESSSKGIGIWKSNDGGDSWNLLSSTELFAYITDIEVRDEDGVSVIYAGVVSGEYYGTHESRPSDGLYRSADGGASWEQVLPNITNTDTPYAPSDIEITSDGRIFIGTMKNLDGNGGATILFSDEGIEGTWSIYDDYIDIIESDNNYPIPGRVRIASSPSNSNYIYAIIGSGYVNGSGFNLSYGNYIIKSTNSGMSWNEMELPTENGNEWASLAWHALGIQVHPNNPNTLFCGGKDLYRFTNNNWTKLSDWALMYQNGGDQYVHADIHEIVFRDGSTNQFVITTDGGVFYSANANLQSPVFEQRNNYYTTLQFYTCDLHPSGLNYFMGGLQDNGTLYTFNSPIDLDNMISGGDGAYCFYDALNDNLTITSTYYNRYYFFNGDPNDGYDEYYDGDSGVFINPADYDTQNNIIYANAVRFNGSNNNRLLKISNTGGIPSGQIIQIDTDTDVYFSHVKVISAENTLLLGTQSGKIYRIEDIDQNYNVYELTDENMPEGNVSCIATANENHENLDTLAVTFSNYGIPSVWTSINQGITWENSESNLPDMPIRWIILHPQNANHALLATEIGIWHTNNLFSDSTEWYQSTNGMANVRVDMLQMRESDNMVLAATHGRGLFYGLFNLEDETLYGDLNNDGGLNIQDVILLVNLILDNDYNSSGDMDQNNILDVLDVIQLIQIIIA